VALGGRAATVKELLKPRSVLVVLGSGGVGKTTIAAALGVAAAAAHLRTAVITVDPARRLRGALGLPRLGGKPTRIDARRLRAAGLDSTLKLNAMVLDVKGEWDAMVAGHVARSAQARPARRRKISRRSWSNAGVSL
jgi:anion-transporting  ArsA/GET3 family ATPase